MKYLGLLMINGENDILEDTLTRNGEFVDAFYVLDGTVPNTVSESICWRHPKCAGYTHDSQMDREAYGTKPRDGWRQHLYEQAVQDHGVDNWFLLLHGDEVWTDDPRNHLTPDVDGYMFLLPFFFPRAGELWDYSWPALEQLQWSLGPGYPEFRMFRGNTDVRFDKRQHSNVTPQGLLRMGAMPFPINHYLYRSPMSQRERAATHLETGFDPDNYRHILDGDHVYWTDAMIQKCLDEPSPYWTELRRTERYEPREGALIGQWPLGTHAHV